MRIPNIYGSCVCIPVSVEAECFLANKTLPEKCWLLQPELFCVFWARAQQWEVHLCSLSISTRKDRLFQERLLWHHTRALIQSWGNLIKLIFYRQLFRTVAYILLQTACSAWKSFEKGNTMLTSKQNSANCSIRLEYSCWLTKSIWLPVRSHSLPHLRYFGEAWSQMRSFC